MGGEVDSQVAYSPRDEDNAGTELLELMTALLLRVLYPNPAPLGQNILAPGR